MKVLMFVVLVAVSVLLAFFMPHSPRAVQVAPEQRIPDLSGTIIGSVLDADGKPVPGAKVSITNLNETPNGRRFLVLSDQDGKFVLKNVTPGRNEIHAFKLSAGYPDTSFAFFVTKEQEIPQVAVNPQQVVDGVIVRLGPKAGILRGKILDSATNKLVKDAQITLRREDDPQLYYSFSSNRQKGKDYFEVPVPPVAFIVEVSASGYETSHLGPLRLKQVKIKRVDIPLKPIK